MLQAEVVLLHAGCKGKFYYSPTQFSLGTGYGASG